jgi:hypothetical protein
LTHRNGETGQRKNSVGGTPTEAVETTALPGMSLRNGIGILVRLEHCQEKLVLKVCES